MNGADDLGNLLRTPQLKSDSCCYAGNSHPTRIEKAWKHFALGAHNPVSLMLEADEENVWGGLFGDPMAEDEGDATSEHGDAETKTTTMSTMTYCQQRRLR